MSEFNEDLKAQKIISPQQAWARIIEFNPVTNNEKIARQCDC